MADYNPPEYKPNNLNINGILIQGMEYQEDLNPTEKIAFMKDLPEPCHSIGAIPTTYLESLSYYEQILWLCKYLQTVVIPAINQNAQAVTQLRSLFIQLMDYYDALKKHVNDTEKTLVDYINNTIHSIVDFINNSNQNITDFLNTTIQNMKDYIDQQFEDLNVQDEINNKLDQMVEDGTLAQIINQGVLNNKLSRFIITPDMTEDQIQDFLLRDHSKIIDFQNGNYSFTKTLQLNKNTIILLNNSVLTFNIPTVVEDYTKSHGFFNFNPDTDEFLAYNGNSNIHVIGGTINGGNFSFCHASNISFSDIHFLNCKNDHVLEMAGINNLLVKNCTFEGATKLDNYKEYIQIDSMNSTAFPHFTSSTNPTYDNTINKNWLIDGCSFIKPSDNNFVFNNAIGNHGVTDDLFHKNIVIKNCEFLNTNNLSMQFMNCDNLIIKNNTFKTDIDKSPYEGCHIRFRGKNKNIVISHNEFEKNYRAIQTASNQFLNHNISIYNNIFTNFKASTPEPIILLANISLCNIFNNIFYNFSQTAINVYKADTTPEPVIPVTDYFIINNSFITDSGSADIIKFNTGIPHINNNNFTINSGNFVCIAINNSNNLTNMYISNNNCNLNYKLYYGFTNNKCSNINDYYIQCYNNPDSNVRTLTNVTPNINFNQFTMLQLTIGFGDNTQIIFVKAFSPNDKMDSRTYLLPITNYDKNAVTYCTFSINSDGSFSYSGNNDQPPLRQINGINN